MVEGFDPYSGKLKGDLARTKQPVEPVGNQFDVAPDSTAPDSLVDPNYEGSFDNDMRERLKKEVKEANGESLSVALDIMARAARSQGRLRLAQRVAELSQESSRLGRRTLLSRPELEVQVGSNQSGPVMRRAEDDARDYLVEAFGIGLQGLSEIDSGHDKARAGSSEKGTSTMMDIRKSATPDMPPSEKDVLTVGLEVFTLVSRIFAEIPKDVEHKIPNRSDSTYDIAIMPSTVDGYNYCLAHHGARPGSDEKPMMKVYLEQAPGS